MFNEQFYTSTLERVLNRAANQLCWAAVAIERSYYRLEINWRIRAIMRDIYRIEGMRQYFGHPVLDDEGRFMYCHRLWIQPYGEPRAMPRHANFYLNSVGHVVRQIEPRTDLSDFSYLSLQDDRLPSPVLRNILKSLHGAKQRARTLAREHDWNEGSYVAF